MPSRDPCLLIAKRQLARVVLKIGVCVLLAMIFIAVHTFENTTTSASSRGRGDANSSPLVQRAVASANQTPTPSRTTSPTITRRPSLTMEARVRAPAASNSVPGQTQVDANTLALYHLDTPNSSAIDATGRYTGTLHGNATTGNPSLYSGVLTVDGVGAYLSTGNLDQANLTQGTIEAYVDFYPQCQSSVYADFPIFTVGPEYGSGGQVVARLRATQYLVFQVWTATGWQTAISGINPCRYLNGSEQTTNFSNYGLTVKWPYETWRFHHVAGTWGPRGVEIWVDGVLHGVGIKNVTPIPPGDDYNAYHAYWCNPQDQVASMFYPTCQTPVAGVVPGQGYGGGINPYSTILVGCDPGGACFKGNIDEVRISNTQRSFNTSIIPTLTPTPTKTPDPITGEHTVDIYTLGLYHLNGLVGGYLKDETGQHNGTLASGARIVSDGRFGGALFLDGVIGLEGYPPFANLGEVGNPVHGTVETWFKISDPTNPFALIHSGDTYGLPSSRLFLGKWPLSNTLRFGINDGTDMHWVDSGINPASLVGCWHFAAGTWGPRGLEIWVDGVWRGATPFYGAPQNMINAFMLGCDSQGHCFKGRMDEVRISETQRTFSSHAPVLFRRMPNAPSFPQDSTNSVFFPMIGVEPTLPPPSASPTSSCPYG